jgi:hypothetical protein
MARPNVKLHGDDVILMQYERQCRREAEAERSRLYNQAQLDERHSMQMLVQLVMFGAVVTCILLTAWYRA